MCKRIVYFVVIFTQSLCVFAQTVVFGANNYVEYQVGTLPIILSVPHGGNLAPASIPKRACNNPVYTTDAYTVETALEIKKAFYDLTGCYPHIVLSHLKRSKLDPNRNIADGACGNNEAEIAWNEFHSFIDTARNSANQHYQFKTFFVDLHGHGNPIQRIELGYLLSDHELELSDNVLNTEKYLNYSSIRNLAVSNKNSYTHAHLLRGEKSFGSFLTNSGFPSVPSRQIPYPGTASNYFSGGFITANHTCYAKGVDINGLQMELNYSGIRDNAQNRAKFAKAFAQSMIDFLNTHFTMEWHSCKPLSSAIHKPEVKPLLYPNPVKAGESFVIKNLGGNFYQYHMYNFIGRIVKKGKPTSSIQTISTKDLLPGEYLIVFYNKQTRERQVFVFLVW
jgi:hypothetical protein